jgi:hypothetical protein
VIVLGVACTAPDEGAKHHVGSQPIPNEDVEAADTGLGGGALPDTGSSADTDTDTGTTIEDTGGASSRFIFGPVQLCPDPLPAVRYTDVAETMGLTAPTFFFDEHTEGGSAAVADFDQDGDVDIVMANRGEPPVLFDRSGDTFERILLPGSNQPTQLSVFDADKDDRLDIAFGGFTPEILLNEVGGWRGVALPLSPTAGETSVMKSVQPGDIDRDGILDIYVLMTAIEVEAPAALDFIAMGNGDGTFTPDASQVPEDLGNQAGFDVQWLDWDKDGWWDVYVVNELFGSPGASVVGRGNFLLRNNGGALVSANEGCFCDIRHDGMGVHMADYNRDGRPDLYLAATAHNVLLEMVEDGGYVDVSAVRSADPLDGTMTSMGWGAVFLDFDNDGRLDIAVAQGDLWHEFSEEAWKLDWPALLLRQTHTDAGWVFTDVSESMGFSELGSWRSVVAVDHNGDGIVDPLVTDVEKRPMLLMSEGCTANGWLEVDAPMHSRVEVTAGGEVQTGWTTTHSSFGGAHAPVVHFGLGEDQSVERISVTLPGGEVVTMDTSIAARRQVRVR